MRLLALAALIVLPSLAFASHHSTLDVYPDCAHPQNLRTNGARLKCGLPPLPPTRRWNHNRPLRPRASPVYCASVAGTTGYIEVGPVTATSGQQYLGSHYGSNYAFGIVPIDGAKMTISFPAADPFTEPFEIAMLDAEGPYTLLGGASSSVSLNDDDSTYAQVTGVLSVEPDNEPEESFSNDPAAEYMESAIWNYNCETNELTVQWENAFGAIIYPSLVYNPGVNNIFITDNPDYFVNPTIQGSLVHFTYIPNPGY